MNVFEDVKRGAGVNQKAGVAGLAKPGGLVQRGARIQSSRREVGTRIDKKPHRPLVVAAGHVGQ